GTYSVTVTDSSGCSASASYFIRENNTLKLSYSVTPTTCLDNGSGAINISVSGGSPPYSYSWSNGATTKDLNGLTSGSYAVTVKDSLGCEITTRILVFKNTFQVGSEITQPLCWGDATGAISLTPSGGVAPYQFSWTNGSTAASLTNLAAGNYSVTVTDSTGCSKLLTYSIVSPSQLQVTSSVVSTSCNASSITLTTSGGTAPYGYQWSTGAQTQNLSNLPGGTYTVTITDAKACTLTKQIVIDSVSTFACTITPPTQPPVCLSGNNKIYASVVSAASYQWRIVSADSSWRIQSGATSDTLIYTAGNQNISATFTLTISKNGCTQTCSSTITACVSGTGTGNETCGDCFKSSISKTGSNELCTSYEVNITTDGNCKYDLSHFVIAIPCGQLSDYSDSGNWPLVVGKDPTTGLVGLKVDNVNNFGNQARSFVLKFTVCYDSGCGDVLRSWNPVVAYKAGQCISYDTLSIDNMGSAGLPYPNPFTNSFSINVSCDKDETVTVELYDQFGKAACEPFTCSLSAGDNKSIQIDGSSLVQNIYLYRIRSSSKTITGRILKKN
ncbi:MAG TPA: T9SS type A sorting domain-containing protein, partial [Cyclobacteriaceae bacterium]|nr:T9SS type A sorting domain-containing protein [Cyclobacteriaceae bacterium]